MSVLAGGQGSEGVSFLLDPGDVSLTVENPVRLVGVGLGGGQPLSAFAGAAEHW